MSYDSYSYLSVPWDCLENRDETDAPEIMRSHVAIYSVAISDPILILYQ